MDTDNEEIDELLEFTTPQTYPESPTSTVGSVFHQDPNDSDLARVVNCDLSLNNLTTFHTSEDIWSNLNARCVEKFGNDDHIKDGASISDITWAYTTLPAYLSWSTIEDHYDDISRWIQKINAFTSAEQETSSLAPPPPAPTTERETLSLASPPPAEQETFSSPPPAPLAEQETFSSPPPAPLAEEEPFSSPPPPPLAEEETFSSPPPPPPAVKETSSLVPLIPAVKEKSKPSRALPTPRVSAVDEKVKSLCVPPAPKASATFNDSKLKLVVQAPQTSEVKSTAQK
jgi:hypothetical protein